MVDKEMQFRRRQPPKPATTKFYHRFINGVSTLYISDLVAIYKIIHATQQKEQAYRDDQTAKEEEYQRKWTKFIENRPHLADPNEVDNGLVSRYREPLILIQSEDIEFDSMEQVGESQRPYFREFNIKGRSGSYSFEASAAGCSISAVTSDENAEEMVGDIAAIVKNRQSLLLGLLPTLCNVALIAVGTIFLILFMFIQISIVVSYAIIAGIALVEVWLIAKGVPSKLINRRYIASPRFEGSLPSVLNRNAVLIGLIGGILAAVVGAVVGWLLNR